jgi:hypothetical protein
MEWTSAAMMDSVDAQDPITEAYRGMLREVAIRPEAMGDGWLTSHWPLVSGAYEPGGLLVVGQAVYGWVPGWHVSDLASDAGIERILEETRSVYRDRPDPMDWIATNRVRSSPFWRVVRRVAESLPRAPHEPWYASVAWANLYPIAPGEVAGNPTDAQVVAQRPGAARVLSTTVAAIDPGLVLVLAGPFWWGYREHLGIAGLKAEQRPLYETGVVDGRRWIVGWHPGGAKRRGWSAGPYAERIVAVTNEMRGRPSLLG